MVDPKFCRSGGGICFSSARHQLGNDQGWNCVRRAELRARSSRRGCFVQFDLEKIQAHRSSTRFTRRNCSSGRFAPTQSASSRRSFALDCERFWRAGNKRSRYSRTRIYRLRRALRRMQTPGEQTVNWRQRFADFFGLKRNLVILLIAIFVIGAGEELWMRFVPKYLQAVGATVFVIGLYDALRTLLSAIYAYPGGVFADRWGHCQAFIIFNFASIVGYALVLIIPHWAGVIAGMFFFLSWSCFSLPATFSLVAATLKASRHSMGIGVQSVIKRLPIMIAPIFGGILIDRYGITGGVRIGLLISIVLSGLTILVQRQLRDRPKPQTLLLEPELVPARAEPERWSLWRSLREFNSPMRRLLLSDRSEEHTSELQSP